MSRIPHLFGAAYIVLRKGDQVLLQRRRNTGFMDGYYSLPAGHVEKGEAFSQTLAREIAEEIGITVDETATRIGHISHRFSDPDYEAVDIFYTTEAWVGEPTICEPEKADELSWHDIRHLPENTIPYIKTALALLADGIPYSEYGYSKV